MKFEDYVLTYKNSDNEIVITVASYYEKYIKPLDTSFTGSFYRDKLVLCCFHNDVNPSLGQMNHKHLKGVKVYHCFGCGKSGDVIKLHIDIEKKYHNRIISTKESCMELCNLFGVDASGYLDVEEGDQSAYVEKYKKSLNLKSLYTQKDYSEEVLNARSTSKSQKEVAFKVGTANIKYIATKKKLID